MIRGPFNYVGTVKNRLPIKKIKKLFIEKELHPHAAAAQVAFCPVDLLRPRHDPIFFLRKSHIRIYHLSYIN